MLVLQRLRLYHAALAILVVLAYLTGEAGIVHAWLGYAVAAVIAFRLVWATTGVPQPGLTRFYPHFQGLRLDNAMTHPAISRTLMLAIATTVVITTLTGIAMDRGRALGVDDVAVVTTAQADDDRRQASRKGRERDHNGVLGEVHEAVANMILPIVALHVLLSADLQAPARALHAVPRYAATCPASGRDSAGCTFFADAEDATFLSAGA